MSAIMKKLKNGHHFINICIVLKMFKLPTLPKVWVSGLPHESPMCSLHFLIFNSVLWISFFQFVNMLFWDKKHQE